MTFLVVALQSEAKPLVRHLGLEGSDARAPYRIYRRDDVSLVVTGIGRVAAAAASAYLFAGQDEAWDRSWINIGIAGHGDLQIGEARLADKISEAATNRSWYPSLVFDPPVATSDLITVDAPESDFSSNALYDMEASGFFSTASRFTVVELIQVLKVVSDNRREKPDRLSASEVSRLIESHLPAIDTVIEQSVGLERRLAVVEPEVDIEPWTQKVRFSVSQRRQLTDLLKRLTVLEEGRLPEPGECADARTAAAVIEGLNKRLRSKGFGIHS